MSVHDVLADPLSPEVRRKLERAFASEQAPDRSWPQRMRGQQPGAKPHAVRDEGRSQ